MSLFTFNTRARPVSSRPAASVGQSVHRHGEIRHWWTASKAGQLIVGAISAGDHGPCCATAERTPGGVDVIAPIERVSTSRFEPLGATQNPAPKALDSSSTVTLRSKRTATALASHEQPAQPRADSIAGTNLGVPSPRRPQG